MAARDMSREDALSRLDHKHACHILLYADSQAKLFGKIPVKHIVLVRVVFKKLFFLTITYNMLGNSKRTAERSRLFKMNFELFYSQHREAHGNIV